MKSEPDTSNPELRIRRMTRLLVPLCWGTIAILVVPTIAGLLYTGTLSRLVHFEKSQLMAAFLLPMLYWASLLFLILRFFQACSRHGALTPRSISILQRMSWLILLVGSLKLLFTLFGIVWISSSNPLSWTLITTVQQVAPTLTNLLLGAFLLLLSRVLAFASILKEENELTI